MIMMVWGLIPLLLVSLIGLSPYKFPLAAETISANALSYDTNLGLTSLFYRESGVNDYSELALTLKAGVRKVISPNWDLTGNFFITALPMTQSGDASARFLGVNLRAGYQPDILTWPWFLTLYGGIYYTTMFVTENQFGFAGMAGPQFFPTIQYQLNKTDGVRGYFKISPVSSSETESITTFRNRELAIGGGYSHSLGQGHTLSITADISNFHIVFPKMAIWVNTYTLGVGYSF